MKCKKYGHKVQAGAMFCNICGEKLGENQLESNQGGQFDISKPLEQANEYSGQLNKSLYENNKSTNQITPDNNIEQLDKKKKRKIITAIIATIAILIVLGALASGSSKHSEEINHVKNGYFEKYSQDEGYSNVGKAFENYFGDSSWKSFTSDDDTNIVEFRGTFMYYDEETDCCLQFKLYDDGSFDIYAVEFNEIPQDRLTISVLLEDIMDEAQYMD